MANEILGLPGRLPTPLYRRTFKAVQEIDLKLTKLIHKWRFLNAGPPMKVEQYDGSEICYQGIAFSGTPVRVFWNGFIEPYLENYSITVLEQTSALAIECQFPVEETVEEAKLLLLVMVRRIYSEMAETDRLLRGDGFNFPDKRDVSGDIDSMSRLISEHANIEKMKKPSAGNQIFNFENVSGNNVQIGNDNRMTHLGVQEFFDEVFSSGDEEANIILMKLLNNQTISMIIEKQVPELNLSNKNQSVKSNYKSN